MFLFAKHNWSMINFLNVNPKQNQRNKITQLKKNYSLRKRPKWWSPQPRVDTLTTSFSMTKGFYDFTVKNCVMLFAVFDDLISRCLGRVVGMRNES